MLIRKYNKYRLKEYQDCYNTQGIITTFVWFIKSNQKF